MCSILYFTQPSLFMTPCQHKQLSAFKHSQAKIIPHTHTQRSALSNTHHSWTVSSWTSMSAEVSREPEARWHSETQTRWDVDIQIQTHTHQLNTSCFQYLWILSMVVDAVENNAMNKWLAVNTQLHLMVFNTDFKVDLLHKVYLNCAARPCLEGL